MTLVPIPNDQQLSDMRSTFAAHFAATDLLADAREGSSKSIPLSTLFAYASGAMAYPDAAIENQLRSQPGMRNAYRRMMTSDVSYSLGTAMAASDGDLLPRSGDGCSIRFEKSQAEADKYYVIIELTGEGKKSPDHLVLCDQNDRCHRFPLPTMRRGIVQFLVEANADLLDLFRDPTTEVFLR